MSAHYPAQRAVICDSNRTSKENMKQTKPDRKRRELVQETDGFLDDETRKARHREKNGL